MNHREMVRREFLAAWASIAIAWPLSASAQKSNIVWRIGVIVPGPAPFAPFFPALLQGLRELGYVDGQNIVLEPRWIADQRMPAFETAAAELVKSKVDLIVTGDGASVLAAKNATSTIPIVMAATGADPVEAGLAASLARPGGNITDGGCSRTHSQRSACSSCKKSSRVLHALPFYLRPFASRAHTPMLT
jgi:putative tryptophan/tyrosine transport system substrate-binding protein